MNRIRELFARIGEPQPAPPWTITSALTALIFALIAMFIGAGVVVIWGGTGDFIELAGWSLGGLLIIVFVWQTRQRDRDALRLQATRSPILFVMFVSLGLAIALDLLNQAVTQVFTLNPELIGLHPNALGVPEWVFAILFLVIIQPVAEGLVFRGILLPTLRTSLGAWGGIIAASVLAGVFHMLVYPPNYNTTSPILPIWYGALVPIIEALIFCMVRDSTKSTRAAIAAQIVFGIFAVIKLLTLTGVG
ncbi:MAG TPA: type II CAAX endopeptidase family protein [Phototrophicaceae bacterium]|nr:type II CAAX endopeptidase family protein [Phototrophicaceae bacterium]